MQQIAAREHCAVPRQFIIKSLDRSSADQAFALARNAAFGLRLEEWRHFLEESAGRHPGDGGVLAVQNRVGTIQGLCRYHFEPALGRGKVCSAEILVALDLVDEAPVAVALIQALEDLARRKSATALRLRLAQDSPPTQRLIAHLVQTGHRVDAVGLIKDLGAQAAAF
jgi:hypothetical protein